MAASVYSERLHVPVAEICVISDSVTDGKPRRLWVVTPGGLFFISKNTVYLCSVVLTVGFLLSLVHPKITCGCGIR